MVLATLKTKIRAWVLFKTQIKTMIDIRLSDNLDLMAEIEDNTVDLIYCDILYGTGRKFTDYQDLKPKRNIIEEHYIPRIKEMHRILKDTGSIYLQMDTKINHWMRVLIDEIFNYSNFRNEIVWCYSTASTPNIKQFPKTHDVILWYSKTNKWKFNKDDIRVPFKNGKPNGGNKWLKEGDNIKDWQNKQAKKGKIPFDWISDIYKVGTSKEKVDYNTQKPKALVELIIKASSNEGDLIADFYAGSFTTAEVCKDLNRNFIGCDISEKAVAIGLKRVGKND